MLPWTKILEVFVQIVRPVAFMHAMQPPVTHRDLKFENVLVAQDGTLRLCDFGSASTHMGPVRDKADRNEQEDAILRYTTPHFRSPEMCDLFNGRESRPMPFQPRRHRNNTLTIAWPSRSQSPSTAAATSGRWAACCTGLPTTRIPSRTPEILLSCRRATSCQRARLSLPLSTP